MNTGIRSSRHSSITSQDRWKVRFPLVRPWPGERGATQHDWAPTNHMVPAGVSSTAYVVFWKTKQRLRMVKETTTHVGKGSRPRVHCMLALGQHHMRAHYRSPWRRRRRRDAPACRRSGEDPILTLNAWASEEWPAREQVHTEATGPSVWAEALSQRGRPLARRLSPCRLALARGRAIYLKLVT